MQWRVGVLAVALLGLAGCGDEATAPTVGRDQVAGTYDMTVLAFDPVGAVLQERSILPQLPPADRPELKISPEDNSARLEFRDPVTKFVTPAIASYRLREFGIELTFQNPADAARILLPRRVSLTLNTTSSTLQFSGDVTVPLARLQQLVPEWQDIPLADPVPGELKVAFTRRAEEE